MNDPLAVYKLAIRYLPGVGAIKARDLISYCGGIQEVFQARKRKLLSIPGIGHKIADAVLKSDALNLAEEELKKIEGKDIRIISFLDECYPKNLHHHPDAPLILYIKGNLEFNTNRQVAIVGTRNVTTYGTLQCEKIVEQLRQFNCTIISGLAHGVDTIAHRKAVESGMSTIGVLGNGLRSIYPAENHDLARRMLENGGVISEFSFDTKPDRENFPQRNRIIAGMADVIIVIESAIKGGSIITAEYANNYNKDVFAIPGRLTDDFSAGCNHLIKTHKAHLLSSADDIAYIMRWDKTEEPKQLSLMIDLLPEEESIVTALKKQPEIGLDSLHYKTKMPLGQLTTVLLNLEFKGIIKSLPGKKYILSY